MTPALFVRAATLAVMARLFLAEIRWLIREIGLANIKAKSLKRLSEILVADHGGEVLASFVELEVLPGVGHKTASVVRVQAFGLPAFPVDTHIHRLAARWGFSGGSSVEKTERDLKRVFPEAVWEQVHLQIIYFGHKHCPARFHDLDACPICSWAASAKRKREERRRDRGGTRPRAGGRVRRSLRRSLSSG